MAESSASTSRLGMKNYHHHQMGEIVEVQGGHIVRSTGRKDRHSKVCTAKGPRDRRVRLSAHTAIQFYDVQDRLGYDRPSKAVDWLIKKAKAAIDELDQLPAWNPANSPPQPPTKSANPTPPPPPPPQQQQSNSINACTTATTSASAAAITVPFLPPSLDSDAIADTIKSFFPIVSGDNHHHHHHHHHHTGLHYSQQHHNQNQDLRLSLQSLQDPIPIFHHAGGSNEQAAAAMFSAAPAAAEGTSPIGFGWSDHHNNSQRISFESGSGGNSGGFGFNSAADNNNNNNNSQLFFSTLQRGPLQSSNTTSVRANWIESQSLSIPDHHHHNISHSLIHHQNSQASSSMPAGIGMGMGFGVAGGISSGGFHYFPARIQGEEEHHGGADKPSSASSDSRH